MALGKSSKLAILDRSPYDLGPSPLPEGPSPLPTQHWVPSRYNIRATAEDGRLVLWNTLSGKITVFKDTDRETIVDLLKRKGFVAAKTKLVKYLADRGYLIDKGVNEYRLFQQLFGQQHYRADVLELILLASEDCNFRCTYCYEDFARGTMIPAVRDSIKKLVRKRIGRLNRLNVSWFGGEPLYGMEAIDDLAPFFVEIAGEHEVPYSSSMTTNGYLLTPDVVDKLLRWRVGHFQITLDGLPEHHNHTRVGRDGSPTFERIFDNLKAMARRDDGFHVGLRVNFDQKSAGGLPKFIEILAQEFRHDARFTLQLHAVGKWGGANDSQIEMCGTEEAVDLQRQLLTEARRQGLHFGSLRETARMGNSVCYAARPYNFVVGATGKVMKCTVLLDKQASNVIGRITPEGDLEVDDHLLSAWTEPAFEQDDKCRKCVMLPNCQGISCPLIRMQDDVQPCISARSNPKGELLLALDPPAKDGHQIQLRQGASDPASVRAEPSQIVSA
jgi:uncharacterized protein